MLSADEEPLRAENGAMMHPVAQRERGDGLAYTESFYKYETTRGPFELVNRVALRLPWSWAFA
jgi:hypothetical protein